MWRQWNCQRPSDSITLEVLCGTSRLYRWQLVPYKLKYEEIPYHRVFKPIYAASRWFRVSFCPLEIVGTSNIKWIVGEVVFFLFISLTFTFCSMVLVGSVIGRQILEHYIIFVLYFRVMTAVNMLCKGEVLCGFIKAASLRILARVQVVLKIEYHQIFSLTIREDVTQHPKRWKGTRVFGSEVRSWGK